jgi:acyl-CoA synthetase (AMP-forming)/AMP-acid ligase II
MTEAAVLQGRPWSIPHLLVEHVTRTPAALAMLAPGRAPLTYGRLWEHVRHVVQTLHTMGLARHDRVALALPHGPEMATAVLGVAAGATCVPHVQGVRLNHTIFAREERLVMS